jgi:hypothetical protein
MSVSINGRPWGKAADTSYGDSTKSTRKQSTSMLDMYSVIQNPGHRHVYFRRSIWTFCAYCNNGTRKYYAESSRVLEKPCLTAEERSRMLELDSWLWSISKPIASPASLKQARDLHPLGSRGGVLAFTLVFQVTCKPWSHWEPRSICHRSGPYATHVSLPPPLRPPDCLITQITLNLAETQCHPHQCLYTGHIGFAIPGAITPLYSICSL